MKCPSCKQDSFETVEIDPGLNAVHCRSCGGHWVSGEQYWAWLRSKGPNLPEIPAGPAPARLETDSASAKLCPNCGRVLARFSVGHGLSFVIEHCSVCEGVWLDKDEWSALKARNLHDDLQLICDSLWQGKVVKQQNEQLLMDRFARVLGADFERAKQVREWISTHPNRSALLAFLADHLPPVQDRR